MDLVEHPAASLLEMAAAAAEVPASGVGGSTQTPPSRRRITPVQRDGPGMFRKIHIVGF